MTNCPPEASNVPNSAMPLTPFLNHIFRYLSRSDLVRAALTCRAWSTPALNQVWSTFKFVKDKEFEQIFSILARQNTCRPYRTFVTSIDLHHDRELTITPSMVLLIATLCNNLETIAFTFHHTRAVAIPPPIPPRQAAPHALSQPAPAPSPSVTTDPKLPLAHLAHNCKRLRSLRLSDYVPRNDDAVYEFAKHTRGLETIIFSGCFTLQTSTLRKLAMTNPQLRRIEIMNTPVSDASISTIADRCSSHVEHLVIGNARQLSEKSLRSVVRCCKELRHVCLFNNADLPESVFVDLIRRCQHLQVLSVSNARQFGESFFAATVERIQCEMARIEQGELSCTQGLQRLCLGAVHRDVRSSAAVRTLVSMSAGTVTGRDSDMDKLSFQFSQQSVSDTFEMPVVRGDSIWWQRRSSPQRSIPPPIT